MGITGAGGGIRTHMEQNAPLDLQPSQPLLRIFDFREAGTGVFLEV